MTQGWKLTAGIESRIGAARRGGSQKWVGSSIYAMMRLEACVDVALYQCRE